jgi:hypothetical protein
MAAFLYGLPCGGKMTAEEFYPFGIVDTAVGLASRAVSKFLNPRILIILSIIRMWDEYMAQGAVKLYYNYSRASGD